jgi:hypothetical protein
MILNFVPMTALSSVGTVSATLPATVHATVAVKRLASSIDCTFDVCQMMCKALLAATRPIQVSFLASNWTAGLQRLLHRNGLGHNAERRAVLRRDVVDLIRSAQRAGARHVLGDQGRVAPVENGRDGAPPTGP